jgi:hypothetical protein
MALREGLRRTHPFQRAEDLEFELIILTEALDDLSEPIEWADAQKSLNWLSRHTGLDEAAALFLQARLVDLSTYYADEEKRGFLRGKLHDALLAKKGKRIMLK